MSLRVVLAALPLLLALAPSAEALMNAKGNGGRDTSPRPPARTAPTCRWETVAIGNPYSAPREKQTYVCR